jgi:hypothetical protein
MADDQVQFDQEIEDLKHELENFQQEKERVRKIIGKIGGMPTFHEKLMNIVFIIVIVVSVVISFFADAKLRLLMIEVATVTLSLKIIYLIHCQMKINHFKFWILSSLEWRLNEMMKILKKLDKSE